MIWTPISRCWVLRGLVAAGFLAGAMACQASPVAPPPPPAQNPAPNPDYGPGIVYGSVTTGAEFTCLANAVVEVLDGPDAGKNATNFFEPLFGECGYHLLNLTPNTTIHVRGSYPGFIPSTVEVFVTDERAGVQVDFSLLRVR